MSDDQRGPAGAGNEVPQWLTWARELQAIGQTGLTYSKNPYDRANYQRVMEIAAEVVAKVQSVPLEDALQPFEIQPGYATVKVDVRAAVVREGRILLVQEKADNCWAMPGGWADVGEIPSEMIAREVREESGYEVAPFRVVGVYDANRAGRPLNFFHAYKVVFLCEIVGGEACISHETLAVDFFSFDDLPPLSQNRTHPRHLADVRAAVADPGKLAVFD